MEETNEVKEANAVPSMSKAAVARSRRRPVKQRPMLDRDDILQGGYIYTYIHTCTVLKVPGS